MRRSRLTIVIGAAWMALGSATAHGQAGVPFDHLKCYRIKDSLNQGPSSANLVPQQSPPFAVEPGCKIKKPARLFCIDVQKQNVQPPTNIVIPATNARDYLCYQVTCPPQHKLPLTVRDQFGVRSITAGNAFTLCAPAEKVVPCNTAVAPMCNGTCPNAGDVCAQMSGTPGCGCQPGCGLNAAGQCAGACPFPKSCSPAAPCVCQ